MFHFFTSFACFNTHTVIRISFVLLSILLLNGFQAFSQKKNYQIAAISFYNFENLFDTIDDPKNWGDDEFLPAGPYNYTEEVYKKKLHNLATVIKQLGTELTPDGPAIIGTAEVENSRVLEDLVSQPEIKDRNYQFIHFDSPDPRGIDVAMLYNPDYFRVLQARALKTDISRFEGKGGRTRDVLYVSGILAGDTVHVFVNHWPSRRGGEAASAPLRAIAANVSKRIIDSLTKENPDAKAIIMGDLNDDPVDASVAKVLGAKGNKKDIGPTGIFNPFTSFYKKGIGTLGYNDSWNLFDQIMITGGLVRENKGWRFYKAEVFNRDFLKTKFGQYKGYPLRSFSGNAWQNGYSDHFPTLIYLVREIE